MVNVVAYQGTQGAYSHLACSQVFPDAQALACDDFHSALAAVEQGTADRAMIPLENSTAGRVEEIYRLLPKTSLSIIGEHFEPVNHCLLAPPGTAIEDIRIAASHPQALAQCQQRLRNLGIQASAAVDTAIAAQQLSEQPATGQAAIASSLAAELYGLEILRQNFQDVSGNTTRFLVFAREQEHQAYDASERYISSLLFTVRNIPAALYKALGGFATNGVNLIKLESYMDGGTMEASHFHVDMYGHPQQPAMQHALEELRYFARELRLLGTYPAHSYRFRAEFV
ncbi:prephenate dehydratase [Bacterioplanes sanyensis]|uniref:prephenate dehydratase n=1 Tax=Bacterioplanes sanyensis TaxID=1249553 RepID=A0A222FKD0_9GAMM|nr:prephenate dehydratase [Bacterioplanes sanyensis]ASP39485.1 prephenate dehydratase [Bacterioplanes sanyensis]